MISKTQPQNFNPKYQVVSCFCENEGKFLMLQRNAEKSAGDKWGLPAGKMENNESLEEAIMRELLEEVSLASEGLELLYHSKYYVEHYGYQIVFHVFRTDLDDPSKVKLNKNENQSLLWVTPEESVELDLVEEQETVIRQMYDVSA